MAKTLIIGGVWHEPDPNAVIFNRYLMKITEDGIVPTTKDEKKKMDKQRKHTVNLWKELLEKYPNATFG